MKLSELILKYGDENVVMQNLDECIDSLNMSDGITRITFGTPMVSNLQGTEKLGVVLWLDRDRVNEIIAGWKSENEG